MVFARFAAAVLRRKCRPAVVAGSGRNGTASGAASAAGGDAKPFFDAARAAGNRWSYGSPGVGTVGHIGMELLKARSGIAPVHVPYPGYPQVFNAIVGGDLQLSMLPPKLPPTTRPPHSATSA